MANSYIEFDGKYTRINDQICLLIGIIALERDLLERYNSNVHYFFEELKREGATAPPGMIDVELSHLTCDATFAPSMHAALDDIRRDVQRFEDPIPSEFFTSRTENTLVRFVDTQTSIILRGIDSLMTLFIE